MKKIILLSISLFTFGLLTKAQCGKTVVWSAAKADFLDADGNLQDTKAEKITIETSDSRIILKHGDREEDVLKGNIKELQCNWAIPYKDGKTTFKTILEEASGDTKDAVVTIEAKEGKITIVIVSLTNQGRMIKIAVEDYKENI
jgi:hypothetical protein